jgi:hypothetical protein
MLYIGGRRMVNMCECFRGDILFNFESGLDCGPKKLVNKAIFQKQFQ